MRAWMAVTLALTALAALPGRAGAFDHRAWTEALAVRVASGAVDYAGLKADPAALDAYLAALEAAPRVQIDAAGPAEQVAFWVNAYNALTLKAVADRYPIKPTFPASLRFPKNSIRQIPGVWDRLEFRVAGATVTLDGIEHEILRKRLKEPRIHMALVCASKGCPPLRAEAYEGKTLEAQLEDQIRRFLREPTNFRIDRKAEMVRLSPLFKWFAEDFTELYLPQGGFGDRQDGERSALNFIAVRLESSEREHLRNGSYKIEYLEYDWSLNERRQ